MANNQYNFLDYAGLSLFWNNVKSIIEENELATASALTNLDTRVDNVESSKSDKGHTHTSILDVNGSSATTFAYSKAGLNYSDYSWLAGWNGYELRAVSKSQFAQASHTHTKSQITDFPTSLPANGGYADEIARKSMLDSQEKIDNFITANRLEYATFKTTDTNNVDFAGNDGMILSIPWTSTTYGAQIAFDDSTSGTVKVRGKSSTWGNWYTLLHSGNYTTYCKPANIGAAPSSHTHTKSQITDFAHTHTKSQITDFPTSLPASDVYSWAKQSTKPSYTGTEVTLTNYSNPKSYTPIASGDSVQAAIAKLEGALSGLEDLLASI